MKRLCWLPLVLLAACNAPGGPGSSSGGADAGSACDPPSEETARIYEGLKPQCEGCHATGARGFFASLTAFDSLLVRDPRYVVPGDPDDSELVKLLEDRGTGVFKAMPIGQKDYAALVADGTATLPVSEVRAWIGTLSAKARDASPDPNARTITRMNAVQVYRALTQQLGVTRDDFFTYGYSFGWLIADSNGTESRYPFTPVDETPWPWSPPAQERFHALGGSSVFTQIRPDTSVSPTFVETLTQVSQAWCRVAINKVPNEALFPGGGVAATATEVQVKATIARWKLHFLAEPATDAEVDALYDALYLPLLQESNATIAHVGLCSYFVRHPDWIFY